MVGWTHRYCLMAIAKMRAMIENLLKILKNKLFASARTSERTDKDENKILMIEEIDDVDYRQADHLDEIAEINRRNR